MPDIPNVSSATENLVAALAEGAYEYALIGGLAVVLHGYDRFTRDVDALVWDLDDRLDDLTSLLAQRGFRLASPNQVAEARSIAIQHWRGSGLPPLDCGIKGSKSGMQMSYTSNEEVVKFFGGLMDSRHGKHH